MMDGDRKVIAFIRDFVTLFGTVHDISKWDVIGDVFSKGFCYYFAIILKEAFQCGEIYMTSDNRHVVWVLDNVAYDINGVYRTYPRSANNGNFYNGELIPIAMLPNYINSFKHILPGTTKKGYAERQSVGKLMHINDMKKIDSFIEKEIELRCIK